MNGSMIRYILGYVLKLEGALLLLPCLIALIYGEKEGIYYLLIAVITAALGFLLSYKKPKSQVFYLKEGCVATSLSWIVLSLFGCVPLCLTGEAPSFVDALFEIVSGFTTTGASILPGVEQLCHATLMWRSFTHWIGGMGVLVFLLAVVPLSGGSHINLMRAESPGPSVGKLVPKIKASARILYIIYMGLTAAEFLFLVLGRMSVFEAINTSFATAGTGGFGFRNDSFASFSPYLQWVVTIFMILFGVNFNAYYLVLYRKFKKALIIEEIRYYFIIIGIAVAFITVSLIRSSMDTFTALTQASFQAGSIITTTGFSTADFDTWSQSCRMILVL
ncbi:MAG: TrkH family potassium uptake protein, partial [Eubacterium sp.]|nr:TrkH family potassium uptake protein [Eubacterium sp.]